MLLRIRQCCLRGRGVGATLSSVHFLRFNAILVLFALGLILGAELYTAGAEGLHHGEGIAAGEAAGRTVAARALDSSGEEERCADPCHFGQAHFGHCLAFVNATALPANIHAVAIRWEETSSSRASHPPFGLKRPPRFLA